MTPNMISACEAHILNTMLSAYPNVPVFMSGQAVPANESIYVRFWVIPSDETLPLALGGEANSRNVGIVQADVYGPKDRGAGETGDIAFEISKNFHRHPLEVLGEGWVVFKDSSVRDMGDAEEEHRQMMRVPYRYDFKM